jgi:DNA-binding MarR family transcriptional regulator
MSRNKCICIYCLIMSKPPTFALSRIRPLGLRATQFTLLQALSQAGEVSQGTLGGILAIDSTTLTRTLAIMGAVTE